MSVSFVVSGHVDHGKSTLCGHILYQNNYIEEHEFIKLKNEAIKNGHPGHEFAYILDICQEEREKGITHDFNSIDFKRNDIVYHMIDTPGHKGFIRCLIAGLNSCDTATLVGVLIVSAIENEFLAGTGKGQTKEDIILMRSVGINNIIVVINKMDKYNFDTEIYDKRCSDINKIISKLNFKKVEYLPVSGYTGYNIPKLLDMILNLSQELPKTKNLSVVESISLNKIKVQIKILELESILAPGFECIVHIGTDEYQVLFDQVNVYDVKTKKITKQNFARSGDVIISELQRIDNQNFEVRIDDRVIIRQADLTIGFGKIIKN